jgi:hypothetical protein
MAEVLPGNGLQSALASSLSNSATSLTIASGDASKWPAAGEYRAVLWQDATNGPWELVRVTGGQGTATLSVSRAIESFNGDQTARAWPSGTKIAAVMTKDGQSAFFTACLLHEEFMPAASATTVTVSRTPEQVLIVARGGVVQSIAAGHYSVTGSVITFASGFSGSERVVVSYSTRTPA